MIGSVNRRIVHTLLFFAFFLAALAVVSTAALAAGAEVAGADTAAAAVEATTPEAFPWWIEIIAAFGSAVIAALGWALKKLFDYLSTKTTNEWAAGVISRIDDFALGIVNDMYLLVKNAKDRGEWGPEAAEAMKAEAIARLKSYLGARGLDMLVKLLGGGATEVEKFLGDRVELAIARNKNAGKIARQGTSAPPASVLASVDP